MKVSPSILAAPLTRLSDAIRALDTQLTDFIHLDIMDGHFVPPITFGEQISKAIKEETSIPLDVHLMVDRPYQEVPKYFEIQPAMITFHYETTAFPIRLLQQIQKQGIAAGIAINPFTPVSVLQEIFPYVNHVLLMTVEPGYYGQAFLDGGLRRIEELANLRVKENANFLIEVDGGVQDTNGKQIKNAGADIVVAGSFVFKAENPNEQIRKLKDL